MDMPLIDKRITGSQRSSPAILESGREVPVIDSQSLFHILSFAVFRVKKDYVNFALVSKEWCRVLKLVVPPALFLMRWHARQPQSSTVSVNDAEWMVGGFYPWLEQRKTSRHKKLGRWNNNFRPVLYGSTFFSDVYSSGTKQKKVLHQQLLLYLEDLSQRTVQEISNVISERAQDLLTETKMSQELQKNWTHFDKMVKLVTKVNRLIDQDQWRRKEIRIHSRPREPNDERPYGMLHIRELALAIFMEHLAVKDRGTNQLQHNAVLFLNHVYRFRTAPELSALLEECLSAMPRADSTREEHVPLNNIEVTFGGNSIDESPVRIFSATFQDSVLLQSLFQRNQGRAFQWHSAQDRLHFEAANRFYNSAADADYFFHWVYELEDIFELLVFSNFIQLRRLSTTCVEAIAFRHRECFQIEPFVVCTTTTI